MTAYKVAKKIRNHVMTMSAEVMNYKSWSDDFAVQRIREIPEKTASIGTVNVAELTEDQMNDLGFGRWSEDSPMRLIPLWLYPWLPDEIELGCINGKKETLKKSEMDTDNRFGYLAYGVRPANTDSVDLV